MSGRYPGYDVEAKRDTPSWNEVTRAAIDRRLAVPMQPRFFTAWEWETLEAVCKRIMPQPLDRPAIPLSAYVDQKMAEDIRNGYRYASMPAQGEAWRRGLAALDEASEQLYGGRLHTLLPERQDDVLRRMQEGALEAAALKGMPADVFFAHRVLTDITHAYYAHPVAWNEIGFGGPASPRGYVRMKLDRRDPWEAAEATPGEEAKTRQVNRRVR